MKKKLKKTFCHRGAGAKKQHGTAPRIHALGEATKCYLIRNVINVLVSSSHFIRLSIL